MDNAERGKKCNLAPSFNWAELNRECLITIFSRLTPQERWTGPMFVCKSWFCASTDRFLHSVFDLENHFESLTESRSWWTQDFERKIDSMLLSVVGWSNGSLTLIKTRHCSDRSLSFAAQRCPNLEVLSVKSSPNVTDESMSRIAFGCSKLRELDVSYSYEISYESLAIIGRNCPNLKVLKRNIMNWIDPTRDVIIVPEEYMNAFPRAGDSEADAIAKFMPNLVWLEIRFSNLSPRAFNAICEGCKELQYLDLSGCSALGSSDITNATSKLKDLNQVVKPNIFIPAGVFDFLL